jgi:chromosome segregation ATPase
MRKTIITLGSTKLKEKEAALSSSINAAKLELERIQKLIVEENKTLNQTLKETLQARSELGTTKIMGEQMTDAVNKKHLVFHQVESALQDLQREYEVLNQNLDGLKDKYHAKEQEHIDTIAEHQQMLAGIMGEKQSTVDELKNTIDTLMSTIDEKQKQLKQVDDAILVQNTALQGVITSIEDKEKEIQTLNGQITFGEDYLAKIKVKTDEALANLHEVNQQSIDKMNERKAIVEEIEQNKVKLFDLTTQLMNINKREEKLNILTEYLREQAKKVGVAIKLP